ncbi:MAG: cytochrome c biogenesis protein [Cytophagales bacterium]|nr:cytochrome c biogenesis protein [Cytophagales bacterium]MDW8385212.1 cytochrome c biogenesis protein CcsA [Flammeovirgaceae bacterium]
MVKKIWWKITAVLLITYSLIGGLLFDVPRLPILNESIRNLYYHVPMWFSMVVMMTISMICAIQYLRRPSFLSDAHSVAFAKTGMLFGCLGIITGMIWAKFTWGEYWSGDPKQNASAIALLIYAAYFLLRSSFSEEQQRNRLSAIYNIFAFAAYIPLIFVLPRLTDSLHPGNGGNPGFNAYDLDSKLRLVFYPTVVGWILLGVWLASLEARIQLIRYKRSV